MLVVLVAVPAVLTVLALVAVGLPALDRLLAALAEHKASRYLSAPFGHPATVRVHGRPFLTQALRGCYRDVEVVGGLRIGEIAGAAVVAHLTNARLPMRDLLGGRTTELPCDHVSGRVLLPYSELARVAPIPGLGLAFDGERMVASAALPVPGLSQLARITGEAVVTLRGGESVWLRIRGVSVAGVSLPGLVLSQLIPTLNVPIALPPLPFGLRLDALQPTANGLVVDGSAGAVVFRRPDRPAAGPSQ